MPNMVFNPVTLFRFLSMKVGCWASQSILINFGPQHHYLNASLLDGVVDHAKPELLMYIPTENGQTMLLRQWGFLLLPTRLIARDVGVRVVSGVPSLRSDI